MRKIGLHLRLNNSLDELINEAMLLRLPFFQCFLVTQAGFFIEIAEHDVQKIWMMMQHFSHRFLHASYWSNLSSVKFTKHRVLTKELSMAKKLGFTHIIIHPGSAKGALKRVDGIDALARAINAILEHDDSVNIVLENAAHGDLSIGGTLHDFKLLLPKLQFPEKVSFCVDTAHAYSYGYDITSESGRERFINELQETVTLEKIVLIHLNDTYDNLGSKMDRHAIPGEGKIGVDALKALVTDARLAHIPVLMEPPVITRTQQQGLLEAIASWHTK